MLQRSVFYFRQSWIHPPNMVETRPAISLHIYSRHEQTGSSYYLHGLLEFGAQALVWLNCSRLRLFSWHSIWLSICQNQSLPGWIINSMSPLIMWNMIFDLTQKHVLELYGIHSHLRLVMCQAVVRKAESYLIRYQHNHAAKLKL